MSQDKTASPWCGWSVPQCPFLIAYSREALDDIRLAVLDAFFSVPRGGAEIGGILLGRFEDGRVMIYAQELLECEHLTGPSFTLSPKDQSALAASLAAACRAPHGMRPVGWWHSHTRSEIFLSEGDLTIHNQYFPEPWQVALVLKPHSFQPVRAGFFFRGPDGGIHAEASFGEFALEPRGHRQLSGDAPAPSTAPPPRRREPENNGPVVTLTQQATLETAAAPPTIAAPLRVAPPAPPVSVPVPVAASSPAVSPALPAAAPAPAPPAASAPPDLPLPAFAQIGSVRSYRWVGMVLSILAGIGIGAFAYRTRNLWLNTAISWTRPMPRQPEPLAPAAPALGLHAIDTDGQLWILWDRAAPAVRRATSATLVIREGSASHSIDLDATQLQAGSFTYGRQEERVDIALTLDAPGAEHPREVTTYLGRLPAHPPPQPDGALQRQNQKLADDLNAERARSRQLEDSLKREQQRKRLERESPAQ